MRNCPKCNYSDVRRYDKVSRIIKNRKGVKKTIIVQRYRCQRCKHIFRDLPDNISRFKHYDKDIIDGVKDGLITSETLGFEDYPCEVTMKR